MTLETYDWYDELLGTNTYAFTITAPASVGPTIYAITTAPVNSNATIAGWNLYRSQIVHSHYRFILASGATIRPSAGEQQTSPKRRLKRRSGFS